MVGGTSGVLATSIVYPLDIVKTTMQVIFFISLDGRDKWLAKICYIRTPFKLLKASSSLMGFAAYTGIDSKYSSYL